MGSVCLRLFKLLYKALIVVVQYSTEQARLIILSNCLSTDRFKRIISLNNGIYY